MSTAPVAAPPLRLAPPRTRPSAAQQHLRDAAGSGSGRRGDRSASTDPLSEKATLMLIRRVLCPEKLAEKGRDAVPRLEELRLPSLTSRNDVDLELYAFLAIIVREYVQTWYGKITPDETFVAEVLQVIAHCSRALEQRCRTLDLESLLLDEIPDLLDRHITAYRTSHSPISQDPVVVNPRQVYHALCPLPQLSPVPQHGYENSIREGKKNEAVYRQLLVEAILAILLPTEDLENPCLTAIVEQIFSELIVGNIIANKASQPWLLYESICIAARVLGEKKARATQRMVSGTHAPPPAKTTGSKERIKWSAQAIFLTLVHFAVLIFSSLRILATILITSSSLPPRQIGVVVGDSGSPSHQTAFSDGDALPDQAMPEMPVKAPVLEFKMWTFTAKLIQLDLRMPWLSGFLSLLQHQAVHGPGRLLGLNSPLDRLFSHHIQHVLSASHLPALLRTLRGVLFPHNAPGRSSLAAPTSRAAYLALRRRAASAILGLVPAGVARIYFGAGGDGAAPRRRQDGSPVDDVEGLLMVLDDEYCNKHLMYSLLELLLVRLMPELAVKGVGELWEERLG